MVLCVICHNLNLNFDQWTPLQDRIDGIRIADDKFVTSQHFNAEKIHEKQMRVTERYESLKEPMADRKRKLEESLAVQKLFRDVDDEEAWVREKEPVVMSNNRGKDLFGAQNLVKKHQLITTGALYRV